MKSKELKKLDSTLVIPDVHAPYHDKRAWACMVRVARRLRPRNVIVLGDFNDCYAISAHDRDPRRISQLSDEVKVSRRLLEEIEDLGAENLDFDLGNHENWLKKSLQKHIPGLLNMVSMAGALRLKEHGWRVHEYQTHARLGKLYHTHTVGHAGVLVAQRTGQAFQKSVVVGHAHRFQVYYFGDVAGGRHFAACLGWLGDARAANYLHESQKAAWAQGFGIVRHEKNGNVHLQPVPIVDYRAVLDGCSI